RPDAVGIFFLNRLDKPPRGVRIIVLTSTRHLAAHTGREAPATETGAVKAARRRAHARGFRCDAQTTNPYEVNENEPQPKGRRASPASHKNGSSSCSITTPKRGVFIGEDRLAGGRWELKR